MFSGILIIFEILYLANKAVMGSGYSHEAIYFGKKK